MTDRLYALRAIERVDAAGEPDAAGTYIKMGIDNGEGLHAFWISEADAASIFKRFSGLKVGRQLEPRERYAVLFEQRRTLARAVGDLAAPINAQLKTIGERLEEVYSEIGTPVKSCAHCEAAIFAGDPFYYAGDVTLCEPCAPTTEQEIAGLMAIIQSGELPAWAKSEDDVIELASRLRMFLPREKRLRNA